jgi:hypothetical protein
MTSTLLVYPTSLLSIGIGVGARAKMREERSRVKGLASRILHTGARGALLVQQTGIHYQ